MVRASYRPRNQDEETDEILYKQLVRDLQLNTCLLEIQERKESRRFLACAELNS